MKACVTIQSQSYRNSSQNICRVPRAAIRHQVMSLMRARMQPVHSFALAGVRFVHQEESGDRPDGVEFGFAIDQMLEIGGNFQMGDDAAQGVRREVRHRNDVRRVNSFEAQSQCG